jgi:hypothetical protein
MAPRIVYLSWPAKEITGGIKQVFCHVEILRESGFDAAVATAGAEPPGWFETTAPVMDLSALDRERDILVFPENYHEMLVSFASWPNRKVVFCQNHFMVCRGLGDRGDYADLGVCAILGVGRLAADFCRRRFPSLPTVQVPVCVNQKLFYCQSHNRLLIAVAPAKRPLEAAFICDLFRARHSEFRKIPWARIARFPEHKVAAILRDSAIYLSLCRFEAVPLSILEAFACGCVTAGFTGFGAREFTTTKNGFWAAEDDCEDCVEQLERAVRLVTAGGPAHSDMLDAAHLSASYYSRERLARCLVDF